MKKIIWSIILAFLLAVGAGVGMHYWKGWSTADFTYWINFALAKTIDFVVWAVDKIKLLS